MLARNKSQEENTGHPIMEFTLEGRKVSIYANGVVEGCEAENVVSHISHAILPRLWAYFSKFEPRPLWREEYREFTEADYQKWARKE